MLYNFVLFLLYKDVISFFQFWNKYNIYPKVLTKVYATEEMKYEYCLLNVTINYFYILNFCTIQFPINSWKSAIY